MNFKVFSLFNVPLYIHFSTIVFISIFLAVEPFGAMVLAFMLACVTLHEYGHCLAAKKIGWKVQDITLYPIGGAARIHFRNTLKGEFFVAAAGPLVSLVLAVIGFAALFFIDMKNETLLTAFLLFTAINIAIFLFNMLPIFPMDGGRLLRSTLGYWFSYRTATQIAVKFGQLLGLCIISFLVYCAFTVSLKYLFTAGIILFVISKAQEEVSYEKLGTAFANLKIKIAYALNKPEVVDMDISQVISELEEVKDDDTKERLQVDEILSLLKDVEKVGMLA